MLRALSFGLLSLCLLNTSAQAMTDKPNILVIWGDDIGVHNMWLFLPVQANVKKFLGSLEGYPFQAGSSLSAAGINYRSLKAMQILREMEKSGFPINR